MTQLRSFDRRALLLALVALAVYARAVGFEFITFDDPVYVTANPHVTAGLTADGVRWAATAVHAANWHPLTWLSHMADVELFGLRPAGHHLTSVLLHVAATLALFAALVRMTGAPERSLVVAALFALHPTRVESVAWISERKDVLSAFLWFATLDAYAAYAESRTRARYATVLVLYATGLLAKPMLVTLPATLLLLDYWPLARFVQTPVGVLVAEKLPLFALAAAASVVTVIAQHAGGSVVGIDALPLAARAANAAVACVRYVAMLAWPTGLAFFYPLTAVGVGRAVAAWVALAAITAGCAWRVRREPYLLVGWLWFLGTLVPVIGLVQVGQQGLADRFTYVPAVGLFIAVVWGIADLLASVRAPRSVATAGALAVLLAAAGATTVQLGFWRDSETLFRRAVAVTTGNFVAHMNLGHLARARRDYAAAERHYREAARIDPALAEAHADLGATLLDEGRDADARAALEQAIAIKPTLAEAHNSLGLLAARANDPGRARASFERAIAARPTYVDARVNLGDLLGRIGDLPGAIAQYRAALAVDPDSADVNLALGLVLLSAGEVGSAVAPLRSARLHAPGNAEAANALGTALLLAGDAPGAIDALAAAVELRSDWAEAHHHLGAALGSVGRVGSSRVDLQACKLEYSIVSPK